MKKVGVREFRAQAASLMSEGETLVIERHGEPIGFLVPIVGLDRRAGRASLGRLGALVKQVGAEAGLDEETLAREIAGTRRVR